MRRAGRIQRLAHDDTPLHTAAPDVEARIGWLLATSRLYRDSDEYADGAAFVHALADHAMTPSRSLVSRWESGEIPASYEALLAYERVLGLAGGRLSGLVGRLRATSGSGPLRPSLDPEADGFADQLDELIDRAERRTAVAVDWQQLGWHVAAARLVHLPRGTWESIARHVVTVAPRAVGHVRLMYDNAVADLAVVHRSRGFLLDAIEEYLADPAAQVVTSPFNLLERIPDPRSGDLVLDVLEQPRSQPVMVQAISMATDLMARGAFTDEQRARLGMHVLREWRTDPERSSTRLAELIAVLPEGLRAPLTDAALKVGHSRLEYVVTYAEAPSPAADRLSTQIAHGARRRAPGEPVHGEDRMLPRLVRETLFHRDARRRHEATILLAGSPFASGVCDELLALLDDPARSADVRLHASWAIRYLAGPEHRMRVLRLSDSRDELVSGPITLALGHIGFEDVSDQVLRSSLTRSMSNTSRAAMYALGMTGSPGLAALSRSAGAPEWQRLAAAWWEANGPAVHA